MTTPEQIIIEEIDRVLTPDTRTEAEKRYDSEKDGSAYFPKTDEHSPLFNDLIAWFDRTLEEEEQKEQAAPAAEDERIALAAEADRIVDADYNARLIDLLKRIEAHYGMSDDERAVVDWVADQLPAEETQNDG